MAIQTQKDTGSTYAVTPSMDGAVWQVATQNCVVQGVGDEFDIQYSNNSLNVSFAAGSEAVICGSFFRTTSLEAITLVANSTIYLCANIDTSKPNGSRGSFTQRTSSNMQSDNINGSGTSCDLLLYIVTTGATGVTNVVDKRNIIGVGGRTYSAGNFVGISSSDVISAKIGIDTSNHIASYNTYTTYTATQDCWAIVSYTVYRVHFEVDGVDIFCSNANSSETGIFSALIKKGQVVRTYQTGNHTGTSAKLDIYGVK